MCIMNGFWCCFLKRKMAYEQQHNPAKPRAFRSVIITVEVREKRMNRKKYFISQYHKKRENPHINSTCILALERERERKIEAT